MNSKIKKVSFDINMLVCPEMSSTYNTCIGTHFINDLNYEEVTQDAIYDYILKHKKIFFKNEVIKSKTIKKFSGIFYTNTTGIVYDFNDTRYFMFVSNIQIL